MEHLIWDNDVIKIFDSFKDDPEELREMYDPPLDVDGLTDDDYWDLAYREVQDSLGAEKMNLDMDLDGKILAVADLQRWNGRFSAYSEGIGDNLADCLDHASNGEDVKIYTEGNELKAEWLGHDNPVSPTVIRYRLVPDDIDPDDYEDLLYAIYTDRKDKEDLICKLTEPLGTYANKVYGWTDSLMTIIGTSLTGKYRTVSSKEE